MHLEGTKMSWGHQNEPGEQQNVHRGTKMPPRDPRIQLEAQNAPQGPKIHPGDPKITWGGRWGDSSV